MAASMTIRELRAALTQHGCDYSACIEKKEMVRMLEHITQSKAEPSAKRQRSAAEGEAAPLAFSTNREEELIRRLVRALPPLDRRLKEPDTALLFASHSVPAAAANQLRVCTFNLLDDVRVSLGHGGVHSVWDVRRINVLRCLLAIDADAYLCQELNAKSLAFLQVTLGHEYALEPFCGRNGGVGVLYRRFPRADRAVHFTSAGPAVRRRIPTPPPSKALMGIALHVPLECHGLLGATPRPFRVVLSATHLTHMDRGQLQSSNKLGRTFAAHLGRDLLRLPAKHGSCPMILGGDFNTSTDGKRARLPQGVPSLYGELTQPLRRVCDSEDEWEEDEDEVAAGLPRWPPADGDSRPLAKDLWRLTPVSSREFGGLRRGSTCSSWVVLHGIGGEQGVRAREIRERWAEGAECTDEGHIDWLLLASGAASRGTTGEVGWPRLAPIRAVIGTELLVPPLPPMQPALIGPSVMPPAGKIFPSDHYPVFADLEAVGDLRAMG